MENPVNISTFPCCGTFSAFDAGVHHVLLIGCVIGNHQCHHQSCALYPGVPYLGVLSLNQISEVCLTDPEMPCSLKMMVVIWEVVCVYVVVHTHTHTPPKQKMKSFST